MASRPSKFAAAAPAECPICGEDLPRDARACPECGADHNSGWKEDPDIDALGLPDSDFRYQEWVEEEFGRSPQPAGIKPIWWAAAIVLVVAFAVLYLLALWK